MWISPSGKKYVGQAQDLSVRKKRFLNPNRQYSGVVGSEEKTAIDKAREKYPDFSKWEYEVLEYCDIDHLNERETYWISFHKSNVKGIGYNMTAGGDGVRGFHPSEETRKKQSIAKLGKKQTWKRGPLSFESRRKMSESAIKNDNKVYGYSIDTGELLYVFTNASMAANILDIVNGNIVQVCEGKRNLAGGLFWSYSVMDEQSVMDEIDRRKKETHKKLSASSTKRLLENHPNAIPVIEVKRDGTIVRWNSSEQAAEHYETSNTILRAIKTGTRRSHDSTWYYLSEIENGVEPVYLERRKDKLKIPHRQRKVIAVFPDGSEKEYDSIKDAEISLKIGRGSASKVLSSKCPNKTAGDGYTFRYAD